MKIFNLTLEKTNQFSKLFLDYINEDEKLKPFYNRYPSLENFKKQIEVKKFDASQRKRLVSTLKTQYKDIVISQIQQENIQRLLLPETFTITTGHQLNLATGPLYFIYKILTVIRLTDELKLQYPENNFVPVFWMATEDHDIEEINHFHLFGKKYEWNTLQKGAAGRIVTEGLKELFSQIPDFPIWLSAAYSESETLAEATHKVVQYLFGDYGLIALNGDDKNLKKAFSPVIKKDLIENKFAPLVRKTSQALQEKNYKAQAFARDQNFFSLEGPARERIEKQGSVYQVLNTPKSFSEPELIREIELKPENFSPNVILRPLYQEMILPNLAYIGGPGELAYWFQLKEVFNSENIPFPILFPRKFATLISSTLLEKLTSANLNLADLFLNEKDFFELLIAKLKVEKFNFDNEEELLNDIKKILQQKASIADKSFFPAIEAEISKASKGISELGKRLNKGLENRHETELNKLQNLRKKLFPNNELQERHENFLNFYINNPALIKQLHEKTDPFDFKMDCFVI